MSKEFSFKRGLAQVKSGDLPKVRRLLMEAIGVKSRAGFCARVRGDVTPTVSEAKAIEKIFAEHGVKNVWGE